LQPCWSTRSVIVVKVNGYKIKVNGDYSGANFAEATAHSSIYWPEGFDPKAAGVIFE